MSENYEIIDEINDTLNFLNGCVFKLEIRNADITETWHNRILNTCEPETKLLRLATLSKIYKSHASESCLCLILFLSHSQSQRHFTPKSL